jgi:hypothetical protein
MSKKVFQIKILVGGGGGIKPQRKTKTTKIITTQPIRVGTMVLLEMLLCSSIG